MAVLYQRWVKSRLATAEVDELAQVDDLALRLRAFLEGESQRIGVAHVHGAGSGAIQRIVAALLTDEMGFSEEVVLTPQLGFVTRARPDFFFRLGPQRGVLAEVERGGTTTNNHDLKDFWKAHLAPDAHHLFLVVPIANWTIAGLPRERPFALVARRLGAFFGDQRREVDVVSAHIFGYGGASMRPETGTESLG
jgi:hypothetical protein